MDKCISAIKEKVTQIAETEIDALSASEIDDM